MALSLDKVKQKKMAKPTLSKEEPPSDNVISEPKNTINAEAQDKGVRPWHAEAQETKETTPESYEDFSAFAKDDTPENQNSGFASDEIREKIEMWLQMGIAMLPEDVTSKVENTWFGRIKLSPKLEIPIPDFFATKEKKS